MRRLILLLVAASLLSGCATAIFNKAGNAPWTPGLAPEMGAPVDVIGDNSIVLAFSGGGLRAAAFAHGVLTALESVKTPQGDLLDDLAFINSVSGSSLAAVYYGLNGREGLRRFREEVLLPGFESGLRLSLFSPGNLMRMIQGGLNAREDFGDVLDRKVFHGATFADLYARGRPSIRIHATDLYHRVPFPFFPPLFAILCSDLTRYPVADAVAATMAVPMVFAPMVVRSYPDNCPPLPAVMDNIRIKAQTSSHVNAILRALDTYRDGRVRYIKLADGGLTDNFALSLLTTTRVIYGTPYAPMTERDAVKVRRLLIVTIDASRGPNGDWVDREEGPGGIDLALSATDAAVDSAAQFAADAFDNMVAEWERSVIAFRCGLSREEVKRLGGPSDWDCRDVRFTIARMSIQDLESPMRARIEAIPTRLSLDAADIDAAIEGARQGFLALPQLRIYLHNRVPAAAAR